MYWWKSKVYNILATKILTLDKDGIPFKEDFYYRLVQEMLIYLAGSTYSNIQCVVH